MTPGGRPPRVVVRAADPALRRLIVERLSAPGDIEVEEDGAVAAPPGAAAVVDAGITIGAGAADATLTPREQQVIVLLAEGLANKEIADRLSISLHTAKFHVDSLLRKLDAANRAEVVREGIRRGLIGI
ncbi:MAG TPA: helix-turn-helix transcriptional regulator [Spirochaetia bacterium]